MSESALVIERVMEVILRVGDDTVRNGHDSQENVLLRSKAFEKVQDIVEGHETQHEEKKYVDLVSLPRKLQELIVKYTPEKDFCGDPEARDVMLDMVRDLEAVLEGKKGIDEKKV